MTLEIKQNCYFLLEEQFRHTKALICVLNFRGSLANHTEKIAEQKAEVYSFSYHASIKAFKSGK